jgi:hypothetical protein
MINVCIVEDWEIMKQAIRDCLGFKELQLVGSFTSAEPLIRSLNITARYHPNGSGFTRDVWHRCHFSY